MKHSNTDNIALIQIYFGIFIYAHWIFQAQHISWVKKIVNIAKT